MFRGTNLIQTTECEALQLVIDGQGIGDHSQFSYIYPFFGGFIHFQISTYTDLWFMSIIFLEILLPVGFV